jgi:hypothetical protein
MANKNTRMALMTEITEMTGIYNSPSRLFAYSIFYKSFASKKGVRQLANKNTLMTEITEITGI